MSLQCKAIGMPKPVVTWEKAFSNLRIGWTAVIDGSLKISNIAKADSGAYACSAKNLLGKDSAVALVVVTDRLRIILAPPSKVTTSESGNFLLDCAAQGNTEITWKRTGKVLYLTITLFIPMELCFSGTWVQRMPEHTLAWPRTHFVLLRRRLLLKCSNPCPVAV